MNTWSFKFNRRYPVGAVGLVTAENADIACILAERELKAIGLPQEIKKADLVPVVTGHQKVEILIDGDY